MSYPEWLCCRTPRRSATVSAKEQHPRYLSPASHQTNIDLSLRFFYSQLSALLLMAGTTSDTPPVVKVLGRQRGFFQVEGERHLHAGGFLGPVTVNNRVKDELTALLRGGHVHDGQSGGGGHRHFKLRAGDVGRGGKRLPGDASADVVRDIGIHAGAGGRSGLAGLESGGLRAHRGGEMVASVGAGDGVKRGG
eukprot:CAMPEP_0179009492 /NCGR_PEP_ID=MMETSP0795-20121207/16301_1 /TAXON_ID=88552 /ORGANISM="Amoebophrya sp., Strain Ameob2" /LENGTH=192 /DNA_ID=CAMNT_0020704693 /DNA_START=687 /DNA_END=1261 /DNA_ORIENTATION=+